MHNTSAFPPGDTASVDVPVLSVQTFPGNLHVLRIQAPLLAQHALPGHAAFAPGFIQPFSIVRRSTASGQVELLYRSNDAAEHAYFECIAGKSLRLAGPVGRPFELNPSRPRPLLIGDDTGIAATIFLACDIAHRKLPYRPFVILGASVSFPFTPAPSRLLVAGIPAGVIAAMPLLDDLQIANRLVSAQGLPGCFEGDAAQLARHWLGAQALTQHAEIAIFASPSQATQQAVIELAKEFDLPYQVIRSDTT